MAFDPFKFICEVPEEKVKFVGSVKDSVSAIETVDDPKVTDLVLVLLELSCWQVTL